MDNLLPKGAVSRNIKLASATLYYDGACPLCSREMDTLRRCISNNLSLVDIHDPPALKHVK